MDQTSDSNDNQLAKAKIISQEVIDDPTSNPNIGSVNLPPMPNKGDASTSIPVQSNVQNPVPPVPNPLPTPSTISLVPPSVPTSPSLPPPSPSPAPEPPVVVTPPPNASPNPPPTPPLTPVLTPTPPAPDTILGQNRVGRANRVVRIVGITLGIMILLGAGGALAAYRLAPSIFFSTMPASISSKINALWPLHSSFDQIAPADSLVFGSVGLGGDQTKALNQLAARVPGYTAVDGTLSNDVINFIKNNYGLTVDQSAIDALDKNIYFAASYDQQYHLYLALKINNLQKINQILSSISPSANKSLIKQPAYHGVEAYLIKPTSATPVLNTQPITSYLQKNLGVGDKTGLAKGNGATVCKSTLFNACADQSGKTVPQALDQYPAIAVIDRHIILSDSLASLKLIIDGSHKSGNGLAGSSDFAKIGVDKSPNLGSLYVNTDKLITLVATQSTNQGLMKNYAGLTAWNGSVSAGSLGLEMKSALTYNPKRINPLLAKIFASSDQPSSYAKTVPGTSAIFFEGSDLSDELKMIAQFNDSTNQKTYDDYFTQMVGVKLSDFADQFMGRYAISYLPSSKSALVIQADLKDKTKTPAVLDQIKSKLVAANWQNSDATVNGVTITSYQSSSLGGYGDFYAPSYAIKDNTFIFATNAQGIKDILGATTTVADDAQWTTDSKTVGNSGRTLTHVNFKNLYNGVVNYIRTITNNPDQSVSDQERVIAAYLDVFPGYSGVSHPGSNMVSTKVVLPIVALAPDKKAEADQLIKKNPKSIFNLAPFLQPLGTTSTSSSSVTATNNSTTSSSSPVSASASQTNYDYYRRTNSVNVANDISSYLASLPADQRQPYLTTTDTKVDPASALIKAVEQFKKTNDSNYTDTDWPNYYYTYTYDGTTVTVTVLTENKYDLTDNNCAVSVQIKNRWTYCSKSGVNKL